MKCTPSENSANIAGPEPIHPLEKKATEGQIHVPPLFSNRFWFQAIAEEIVHINHKTGGPWHPGCSCFHKLVQRSLVLLCPDTGRHFRQSSYQTFFPGTDQGPFGSHDGSFSKLMAPAGHAFAHFLQCLQNSWRPKSMGLSRARGRSVTIAESRTAPP